MAEQPLSGMTAGAFDGTPPKLHLLGSSAESYADEIAVAEGELAERRDVVKWRTLSIRIDRFSWSTPKMMFDIRRKAAALKSPDAARQAVTGHNMRYVLGFSIAGVIVAFLITASFMGQSLPVPAPQ